MHISGPRKVLFNLESRYETGGRLNTHNKLHIKQMKKLEQTMTRLNKMGSPLMSVLTKYFESGQPVDLATQKIIKVRLKIIYNATKREIESEKKFIRDNKISIASKSFGDRIHDLKRNLNNSLIYLNYLEYNDQLPQGFSKGFNIPIIKSKK